jgi:hypothetical protein
VNAAELAIDGLALQEMESLAACIARGQAPDTYADIVAKLRGHAKKLPPDRVAFWTEQAKQLGVTLYPKPPEPKKVAQKSGGTSVP